MGSCQSSQIVAFVTNRLHKTKPSSHFSSAKAPEIIKNLKFRTVVGYEYYSSDFRSFTPLYHFSNYSQNINQTRVSQNASHNQQITWTNTLSYDWKIKEHSFSALLGTESYQYWGVGVGSSQGILKNGFADWSHAYVSNGTASTPEDGLSASGSPALNQRMLSYFGRLGWNFKETYMQAYGSCH